MKQNQVIAITNGKKSQTEKTITKIYQDLGKAELFSGIDRTYRPIDDEGVKRPPEKKLVQKTVKNSISLFREPMEDMINFVATMDVGNCSAKADIKIKGKTVAKEVPATHLIFLDKQLEKVKTFVNSLPVLDAAEEWEWNSNTGCYASEKRETASTAKIIKNNVMYEATKEHPAQVQPYSIDEVVGYWTTINLSGNIAVDEKVQLLAKVQEMQDAVKVALEEANGIEVSVQNTGKLVMDYLFGEI
jgi:hypothetical protein